jgi:hypothetical protein
VGFRWKPAIVASDPCEDKGEEGRRTTRATHDPAIDEPAVDCTKPVTTVQFPGHGGIRCDGAGKSDSGLAVVRAAREGQERIEGWHRSMTKGGTGGREGPR